jgi:tocopherol O-methyltransferase
MSYSPSTKPPFVARRTNEKRKIVEHYDVVSPYYHSLWGEHIHHGYWIRGDESKEQAQLQLTEHLARLANVPVGAEVLDIGCGFGASSLFLAKKYNAHATGITISPVQVEMAQKAAAAARLNAQFFLMDAEDLSFSQQFDVLWSVESISHYYDRRKFFETAARFLKPGGVFALTDWFKRSGLSAKETHKFIRPIEQGMFIELESMDDYESYLAGSGLQTVHREDLTPQCARSWDIGLNIIQNKSFWAFAAKQGRHFVTYLRAFRAIHNGCISGNFVVGLFVAKKPLQSNKPNAP